MLRNVTALRGDVILARDGDMGLVVDVYFDDGAGARNGAPAPRA
jgi:uncharacterized protein YrrD